MVSIRIDYDAGGVDPVRGPINEWIRLKGYQLYANPCQVRRQDAG